MRQLLPPYANSRSTSFVVRHIYRYVVSAKGSPEMYNKRLIALFGFAAVFTVLVILLPGIIAPLPFCSLRKAGAQDNPCVAQEATIQALKGVLLQSTLDHTNYEGTLTALNNSVHNTVVPTTGPAIGLPFKENFADNHVGWDTTTHPEGKGTIKDGQFTVAIHYTNYLVWYIPNLTVVITFTRKSR